MITVVVFNVFWGLNIGYLVENAYFCPQLCIMHYELCIIHPHSHL